MYINNVNMKNLSVVLLNCKSVRSKLGEIKLMIYANKPDIICLSETWMKRHQKEPNFIHYAVLWKHRETGEEGGGLATLVKSNIQYQEIELVQFPNGKMEVQAIKVFTERQHSIGILNLYNPNADITEQEILHYRNQLGTHYMMIGDYNGQSFILDTRCTRENATGKAIERTIINNDLCLINPLNFYTYLDFRTGKRSCLDLCLTSSNIADDTSMKLLADVGSDHSCILITVKKDIQRNALKVRRKWKTNKENLKEFAKAVGKTNIENPNDIEKIGEDLQKRITRAAEKEIGLTSGHMGDRKVTPWWTAECHFAVVKRNRARKKVERCPTRNNVVEFLRVSANCRRICKTSKKESWNRYINELTYDTPISQVWKKFKSMRGKYTLNNYVFVVNNEIISDPKEKANRYINYLIENGTFPSIESQKTWRQLSLRASQMLVLESIIEK